MNTLEFFVSVFANFSLQFRFLIPFAIIVNTYFGWALPVAARCLIFKHLTHRLIFKYLRMSDMSCMNGWRPVCGLTKTTRGHSKYAVCLHYAAVGAYARRGAHGISNKEIKETLLHDFCVVVNMVQSSKSRS